jgi:hypothetical protein
MKFTRFIIACLCTIAFAGTGWSQNGGPSSRARVIPGYINPQTGVFTPLVMGSGENPEALPAAATKFTGTFVVAFSITVKSSIPTSTPIVCTVDASVVDQSPSTFQIANEIFESANLAATRSSKTASCTVTLPYSWLLSFSSTDTVSLSYILEAQGTTAGSAGRYSSQDIATIPIPANGATTHENVSATL